MDKNIGIKKITGNKILVIVCLVAAGCILGLWIWKSVQISHVKKQSAIEMQLLKSNVTKQFLQIEALHLRSMAKPLVWAVRTEMLKNNVSQVDLYINEMVKEKNFQKIVVTNEKGVVILSTNKKEEGRGFIASGQLNFLKTDKTVVNNINDSLLIMSSPIMGFNNRLGTLIVSYSLQHLE